MTSPRKPQVTAKIEAALRQCEKGTFNLDDFRPFLDEEAMLSCTGKQAVRFMTLWIDRPDFRSFVPIDVVVVWADKLIIRLQQSPKHRKVIEGAFTSRITSDTPNFEDV